MEDAQIVALLEHEIAKTNPAIRHESQGFVGRIGAAGLAFGENGAAIERKRDALVMAGDEEVHMGEIVAEPDPSHGGSEPAVQKQRIAAPAVALQRKNP